MALPFPLRSLLFPLTALAPAFSKTYFAQLYDSLAATLGTDGPVAPVNVASASNVDLSGLTTRQINLTGTTTVNTVTCPVGLVFTVKASGAILLKAAVTGTGADIQLAPGESFNWRATAADTVEVIGLSKLPPLPGYQFGCQLTMPAANATMPITAGKWQDSTGTQLMTVAAMSKTTSAWAAATGNGGRLGAAAVANNTWYDWYIIYNPTTGATDFGFDLQGVVTYPSGYTKSRRIFSVKTNGSGQWLPVTQNGDYFLWNTPSLDVGVTTLGGTPTLYALNVPSGFPVIADINVEAGNPTGNYGVYVSSPYNAPDSVASGRQNVVNNNSGTLPRVPTRMSVLTNTSAQIQAVSSAATTSFVVGTNGWTDTRGRTA